MSDTHSLLPPLAVCPHTVELQSRNRPIKCMLAPILKPKICYSIPFLSLLHSCTCKPLQPSDWLEVWDNTMCMWILVFTMVLPFLLQPKVVTDAEEEELKMQLDELAAANMEVPGDDDYSEEEGEPVTTSAASTEGEQWFGTCTCLLWYICKLWISLHSMSGAVIVHVSRPHAGAQQKDKKAHLWCCPFMLCLYTKLAA